MPKSTLARYVPLITTPDMSSLREIPGSEYYFKAYKPLAAYLNNLGCPKLKG
jgi:hypothetical protein